MKFISSKVHTIIGLIVGVLLLFAPSLFDFSDNETANLVTMGAGIFIILSELITTSRISPLKLVPMRVHLMLDYLTGALILLSPWLFGFADEVAVPHVIVGILVIGYAAMTNPDAESKKSLAE
jgi:hypothetical protein